MMSLLGRLAGGLLGLVLLLGAVASWRVMDAAGHLQVNGRMKLAGLTAPVKVLRDELGVPYIFAQNTPDLIRAQGFVTAQHRLMQMELFRATWRGELAATFGPDALASDIRMRVLGVQRNGQAHAKKLSDASRAWLQAYVDGVNAYIADHAADHPFELKLAGLVPTPWQVSDLVALVHYVNYTHATNFKAEVLGQMLIDKLGAERAAMLAPLTTSPDRSGGATQAAAAGVQGGVATAVSADQPSLIAAPAAHAEALGLQWSRLTVAPETLNHQGLGSNNWAVGPGRSQSGKAMVVNDPHLDNRILPGTWHPVGLFAPGIQAVGAALPGMPGIMVGRTAHVAFGVTNAYGDVQDLYVETIDPANPAHYLDGGKSVPFGVVTETIRIKDKAAPGGQREHALKVRYTRRGPVVTDHEGLGPKGQHVLSLRTIGNEVHAPVLGIEGLLTAADTRAFDREVQKMDLMLFNFVFGDDQGNIGHRATGAVPIRNGADGGFPRKPRADGADDWTGYIPKDRMPGMANPARAWVGTANHDTRPDNYPWYYTNYVAPDYRYRRMTEVLSQGKGMTVADHWALMRDDRNLQSDVLRTALVSALKGDPQHGDLAQLLEKWDGVDRADQAAPLVYQAFYREVAWATFRDELGDDLAKDMLSTWYYWQQRFDALLAQPGNAWFDDVTTTARVESLPDLIRLAAYRVRTELTAAQGPDVNQWRWGKAHTLNFVSPLRRKGAGQSLVGGFGLERPGSGETLNRGVYDFAQPYAVKFFASMQVVVDFGVPDRIDAVLAGGVSERHFQRNQIDQAHAWAKGERRSWWFTPEQAKAHAHNQVELFSDK